MSPLMRDDEDEGSPLHSGVNTKNILWWKIESSADAFRVTNLIISLQTQLYGINQG